MTQTPPENIATGAARLRAEISGPLATITISHPERHNIINLEGWLAFPDLMARLCESPGVRLIMLRGDGGKAFVAGADIAQFGEKFSGPASTDYDAATVNAFDAVTNCPVPTLAAIEGYCIGGGLGLALACDLRFARDDASFAIPAARLGLAYPTSATIRLRETVGRARAKDILFTARRFDAKAALAIGLIDYLAPAQDFETALDRRVAEICANAPLTLRAAKGVLECTPDTDPAELERKIAACFASADYKEGRMAFMEKRPPKFKGE